VKSDKVSTRDLMSRMRHDSVRAAITYQHATAEADARIASSLDAEIRRRDRWRRARSRGGRRWCCAAVRVALATEWPVRGPLDGRSHARGSPLAGCKDGDQVGSRLERVTGIEPA
jgi:hypothetical protein